MFARRENEKPLHLGLTAHCGLCGTAMKVGDACTALLGVDRATVYQRRTPPFSYPKYAFFHGEESAGKDPDHKPKEGEDEDDSIPMMCRNPECTKGTATLEACTVHVNCHAMFRKHCVGVRGNAGSKESLDRLWIAAAWRRPWRQAAWLWLDTPDEADNRMSLDRVVTTIIDTEKGAKDADDNDRTDRQESITGIFHRLLKLPAELVEMIREDSAESLIWRYAAVLDRCQPLAGEDNQLTSMPLTDIAAWERGSPAQVSDNTADNPILRLMIDARGLRSIERLAALPPATHDRHSYKEAYVIVHQDEVKGVMIHFKYGLARLELPKKMKGLHIWDTPTPPSLTTDCSMLFQQILPRSRFQTVPLDRCDGITLLFEHGKVAVVHMHTPVTPMARMNFLSLDRTDIAWVYVPINRAAGDRVIAYGGRRAIKDVRLAEEEVEELSTYKAEKEAENAAKGEADDKDEDDEEEEIEGEEEWDNMYRNFNVDFLFRLKLAGDVSVGPMLLGPRKDTVLATSAPISLIFSSHESFILSVAGAYSESPALRPPLQLDPPFGDLPPREVTHANDYSSFLSTAPLDKPIRRITVFSDPVRDFDRGILIEYKDGGQRALGQCRIGWDDETEFEAPKCLCISRDSYTYKVPKPAARQPGTQSWQVFYAQCSDDISDGHEHEHDDENGIWECVPLGEPGCGRLELWFSSKTGRLTVIEDDEEHKAWRKKRNDASYTNHFKR
ncbi:hypothetical protein Sste5346_006465 [Sporothrix stenoceras]|uniref:Uncharacterized protein n=1 Tax=Sporothrix stenoceras TaxID=5173 RepID=A0ABR3YY31_9PEZI